MRRVVTAAAWLAVAAGCGQESAQAPAPQARADSSAAAERMFELAEDYFEETLALNPVKATFLGDDRYDDRLGIGIAPEAIEKQREMESRFLAAAEAIDAGSLKRQDRLTWEVFTRGRREALEALEFPSELLPVDQMGGMPQIVAVLGSGESAQPFEDEADYRAFISRMDDFARWVDQAIVNMRKGMDEGIVQPRVLMLKVVSQLDALVAGEPQDTLFWGPVTKMPEAIAGDSREALVEDWREKLTGTLLPAYARLRDFVRDEYVPAARDTVGFTALPGGEAWYGFLVRAQTTTDMGAEEIHRLGLSEVSRIRSEMDRVRREVGFEADLQDFFVHLKTDERFFFDSPEQVIAAYRELKERIDVALPTLFSDFPKADYEIRPVEAFRAQSAAGASYQEPSADGERPGIFYVNTFNLKAQPRYGTETLSLHEASPGHHFQVSIAQELEGLPRFRRFGGETAYVEGWALYAESLGPALGLFEDPYQYYGRLNDEQLRAMRLVVDTGLHAMGWSREQAIQYMLDNSSLAETDVVAEVERYIAWPGQALAYKIGQLTIADLRRQAEAELGEDFDLKAWHSMILRGGPLPMAVLTARNARWIAESGSDPSN